MGIFGWSYPPGCSGTPFDDPCYCDICGLPDTRCICPECPVCGEVGRPDCYEEHGMTRSPGQIASLAEATSEPPYDPTDYMPIEAIDEDF
jgi:hypothetical protein